MLRSTVRVNVIYSGIAFIILSQLTFFLDCNIDLFFPPPVVQELSLLLGDVAPVHTLCLADALAAQLEGHKGLS